MKRTFTLLTALLISLSMYAHYGQSRLSISSTANSSIRVMVDGKKYTASGNGVMISSINDGYHQVRIYQLRSNGNHKRGMQGNAAGNGYQLVYSGNIYLKTKYHTDITINRFGKAFVDEQAMGNGYYDEEDDDWSDMPGNYNDMPNRAMDAKAFEQLKKTINMESFDETKVKVAKMGIQSNYVTTDQVKELMELFQFEDSKLEIAKYAYDNTVDKKNYFTVNNAFSFSSSKESLMKYIESRKNQ